MWGLVNLKNLIKIKINSLVFHKYKILKTPKAIKLN